MKTMVDFMKHVNKMPIHWRIWVAVLFVVNLGAVFFLQYIEAWVVLSAVMFGGMVQNLIFALKGFVRLLGLGHFHWFPMLFWIYSRMDVTETDPNFYHWMVVLTVFIAISLAIDVVDVVRYALGERQPSVRL